MGEYLRIHMDEKRRAASTRLTGTLLPVVYVLSLPKLAKTGFANECKDFPDCYGTGPSVSSFICTPQATGAMAATFFYPSLNMWLNAEYVRSEPFVYPTLVAFQLCFGLFLTLPVESVPDLHAFAVNFFCLFGLCHYASLLRRCARRRLYRCVILLWVASSVTFLCLCLGWSATSIRTF